MSRIVPISVLVDVPPDDLCPLKQRNYGYLYFIHFQLPDLARSTPSTRPKKEAERSKLLAGDVPGRPVRHPSYRNVHIHTTFSYQLSSNNPFLELICLFFFYSQLSLLYPNSLKPLSRLVRMPDPIRWFVVYINILLAIKIIIK